jgi:N-acetylmuramoyl-L-alanine amidase
LVAPGTVPVQTIVVDAGHGGHDPGATHHGLREKDLTLDIARRLSTELQSRGFSTVMTRDRDEFISLSRRPAIANRIPADLFVSVHINANRSRRVSGIEVYYPRESVVDTSASFPPEVRPEEVALPTTTIKHVLWDLALSKSRRHSWKLGSHICRTMRHQLGVTCRGVKSARFVVLKESHLPAVLVEVGYMSNQAEASRLATSSYRQAVAQAIAEGVVSYVRELGLQHI